MYICIYICMYIYIYIYICIYIYIYKHGKNKYYDSIEIILPVKTY